MIARTITLVSLGLVVVLVFVGTMFSVVQESSVGTFIRVCPLSEWVGLPLSGLSPLKNMKIN